MNVLTSNPKGGSAVASLEQQFLDRLGDGLASIYCNGGGFRQEGFPCRITGGDVYLRYTNSGNLKMICFAFMAIVPEGEFDCNTPYTVVEDKKPSARYRALCNLLDKPNTISYALSGFQIRGTVRAVSPNGKYIIIETVQYGGKKRHVLIGNSSSIEGNF